MAWLVFTVMWWLGNQGGDSGPSDCKLGSIRPTLLGNQQIYPQMPLNLLSCGWCNANNAKSLILWILWIPWIYSFHALTARALMDNILGLGCQMHKGWSIKRYFQSRHCFADSCELKWTIVWRCVVDRTWLVCHAHTTLHAMCAACTWFRQWIREIISTKSLQLAICENLDS